MQKFQNLESTSFLPGQFCPKATQLEDGCDLFVQDGEVLPLLSNYDHFVTNSYLQVLVFLLSSDHDHI